MHLLTWIRMFLRQKRCCIIVRYEGINIAIGYAKPRIRVPSSTYDYAKSCASAIKGRFEYLKPSSLVSAIATSACVLQEFGFKCPAQEISTYHDGALRNIALFKQSRSSWKLWMWDDDHPSFPKWMYSCPIHNRIVVSMYRDGYVSIIR